VFYRRTFITEGLLEAARQPLQRHVRNGGDPVVELQINFGGGKPHSMLALWHLFAGVPAGQLLGLETPTLPVWFPSNNWTDCGANPDRSRLLMTWSSP